MTTQILVPQRNRECHAVPQRDLSYINHFLCQRSPAPTGGNRHPRPSWITYVNFQNPSHAPGMANQGVLEDVKISRDLARSVEHTKTESSPRAARPQRKNSSCKGKQCRFRSPTRRNMLGHKHHGSRPDRLPVGRNTNPSRAVYRILNSESAATRPPYRRRPFFHRQAPRFRTSRRPVTRQFKLTQLAEPGATGKLQNRSNDAVCCLG